jgi:DNA-binding winged helix-turn-helix (wHTH) protein
MDAALIAIGPWTLNQGTRRLTHKGIEHRLTTKELGVLLQLVQGAPDAVTIGALMSQNWPGVIVTDGVLHQVITRLRRKLGDSSRTPVYIETLTRAGYRMIAPVTQTAPSQPDAPLSCSAERMAADRLVNRARRDVTHTDRNVVALALLEQAVDLDPSHAEAWALLSMCHSFASDPGAPHHLEAAQDAASRALELAPNHGAAHCAMGSTCMHHGRFATAIRHLREASILQPTSDLAALDLCHLLAWNGQLDEAVAEGLRRLRQSPDVNIWWHIGFPLRLLNPEFSRSWIIRGLARHPADDRRTRLKLELMTLDSLHGDATAACTRAERILALAPNYLEGALTSIEVLLAHHAWESALAWLTPRVQRYGHKITTLSLAGRSLDTCYGVALQGIGRRQAARPVFEQALERHQASIAGGTEWSGECLSAAACCAGLGRAAAALDYLDGAFHWGYRHYHALLMDPAFHRLRGRRAFLDLIQRMRSDVDSMATNVLRQGLLSEMLRVVEPAAGPHPARIVPDAPANSQGRHNLFAGAHSSLTPAGRSRRRDPP